MNVSEINPHISLPIMEQFYTLQGEGKNAGRAAYFIRIAGCDVGCVWCDVKESWDKDAHPLMTIESLVEHVLQAKTDFVVITGGEPSIYDLSTLVDALHAHNLEVAIETSGCYTVNAAIDWYCFSPKKFKKPLPESYSKADELKIIIFNKSDFAWAEEHAAQVGPECRLYLQTEWSKQDKLLPMIIDYIKENPRWSLSLQTHKYLNIP